MIKYLYENNPLLKSLEFSLEALKKEKILSYQSFIPDPMPEFLYNTRERELKLALSFEIPPFIPQIAEIKEKNSEIKSFYLEFTNIKLKLKEEIIYLSSLHKTKVERLKNIKTKLLPVAQNNFFSQEKAFITSKIDISSFLDSQRLFYEIKLDYLENLKEILKIRSKIKKLTGGKI